MKHLALATALALSLAGCTAPPASPIEAAARKAAAAELVAKQCAGYAGGYVAVKDLRRDGASQLALARELGATDADIQKARTDVQNAYSAAAILTTTHEACNGMIGELGWAG